MSRTTRPQGVQSIERVLDVLEALSRASGPLGISEISAATTLPYATVHRLCATLLVRGYLVQQQTTRRYLLGPRILQLSQAMQGGLGPIVEPVLATLVKETGETANFAVLDRDQVVYIAQSPSPRMLRAFTQIGNRVLPHATAVGKAILAFQPDEVVSGWIKRNGLPAFTDHTIRDADLFIQELTRVRVQGYAVDEEEQELGVRCYAVAVTEGDAVLGALSISGPTERILLVSESVFFVSALERGAHLLRAALTRDHPDEDQA